MPRTLPIERGLVRTHTGYIHYRAAGSGPAILLAHINQQSSALYLELMQALAPELRVIAIDYPSHGHSDPIDWQPSINTYARFRDDFARIIPDLRLHIIADGRFCMTWERAEEIGRYAIDFVRGRPSPYNPAHS